MSDDPLLEIITGEPAANLNRHPDMDKNIQNVRGEFVGKPEICHEMVKTIIYLRRDVDVTDNYFYFQQLWNGYKDVLLKEYNVRWLLSVLDTVVDHGSQLESATALNMVQCVNGLNIHMAILINAVDGRLNSNKLRQELKAPTHDGMISIDVPSGDTVYNMMRRLDLVVSEVPWLEEIWEEIKHRLRDDPNVVMNVICEHSRFPHQRKYFQ